MVDDGVEDGALLKGLKLMHSPYSTFNYSYCMYTQCTKNEPRHASSLSYVPHGETHALR